MRKNVKMSIITVVYNGVDTLEETILSVVKQNYKNIEYIIIDGESTDGTLEIIKKYQNSIAYWISEPDKGIYDAMNKGINIAKGEWIYFLGSDDWLYNKNVIGSVVEEIKSLPSMDIFCGKVMLFDPQLDLVKVFGNVLSDDGIKEGAMAPHQGMFVKSDLIKERLFDNKYKVAGDFDFFISQSLIGKKFHFSNKIIAYYSILGISSYDDKRIREYREILSKHAGQTYLDKYNRKIRIERIKAMVRNKLVNLRWKFLISFVLKKKGWMEIKNVF